MEVAIRPVHIGELSAVLAIETEVSAYPWSEAMLVSSFDAGHVFLGAWLDKHLIGFLVVRQVLEEAEVLLLATSSDYQGKGVATTLIETWINSLSLTGVERIFLEVASKNMPALMLYKKLDFHSVGVRKNYYRQGNVTDDAWVMEKILREGLPS